MIVLLFVAIIGLLLLVARFAPDPFPPDEMTTFLNKLDDQGLIMYWWQFDETENFAPVDYGGRTKWVASGGIVYGGVVSKPEPIFNEPALQSLHDNTWVYGDIDDDD